HLDGGQTAGFVYLCVNGDCRTATKVGNRYERSYAPVNVSMSYAIEFKVQDNTMGQCLTSANVKPGQAVSTPCYLGSVATTSSTAPSSTAMSSTATSSMPASKAASSKASSATTSTALTCQSDTNPSHVVSGRRGEFTQSWCDTVCVTMIGNDTGCLNKDGIFVSNASICSDPANAKEAMLDIEYNLGIDIDDAFVAASGYQGAVPSLNPRMKTEDVRKYFVALLGQDRGSSLTDALNTNGDAWIDRNEASQAKGSDPRQLLTTGFGCGLSTDDIMAYLGLYMGDGAIDKYAGDLDASVKASMLTFTRSWQPGVSAQACEYRGGCGNTQSSAKSSAASSSNLNSSKAAISSAAASSAAPSNNCPVSHPFWAASCQRCFVDASQAASASCH
ncbi:family 31 carbohydrate-binding protein, partial [Cellvibrio sp. OA-2007]